GPSHSRQFLGEAELKKLANDASGSILAEREAEQLPAALLRITQEPDPRGDVETVGCRSLRRIEQGVQYLPALRLGDALAEPDSRITAVHTREIRVLGQGPQCVILAPGSKPHRGDHSRPGLQV